jgi:AMMECR1 domain-containing protein
VQTIIRLPIEDYERGLPYFEFRENLSKFAIEAVREKINRAEANDKAGRLRKLLTDEELLFTVLKHMKETGKLRFLFT